ncbi:MAG: EAL domain-containing protein [Armatimonadota bacterium]|nr:EAL domain-containing protein [Armatimonadota bacterium]
MQERVRAVRLLQAEFGRRLQQVLARSPARGSLEEKLRQGDQLTERYLALAEGAVVRAERLAVPASEYFAAATRAIDARFDLYREATGVLRETVVRRATRIQRGAWTVAGLLVVLLTAAAVGGVVIARSVTGPLARLVHALERLEEGDLHVEVGLRGQDEVAYLAQTFDRVTARLRLATRQQELLRSLAGALNQHVDLQPMLQEACPVLQELLGAEAVWIYVLEDGNFRLEATAGIPPGLAEEDYRELRWQPCRCQERLLRGELRAPVNLVECLRLEALAHQVPDADALPEKTAGLRVHASVPLRSRDKVMGLMNFARSGWTEVDDRTLQLAGVAADTLAVAIARAQLHAEAELSRRKEREATAALARTLLGVVDLKRVGAETFAVVGDFLGPDGVALLVRDPSESQLELVAGWGWPEEYRWVPLQPATSSPVAWAVAHRKSTVEDLARQDLPFEVPGALRASGTRTVLVLPLLADRRPTGALVLTYRQPRMFRQEELAFAAAVAGVAGVAVERALEHRQNRLLFEEVPVGLYRSTPSGRFLDVNRVLVRILGYPDRESLLSTPTAALYIDPEDRTRWQELMHQQGVVTGFETYWRRWDGEVLAVRESARVVRDAFGRPAYYEGAVEDITARKELEANLYLLANYDGLTGLFNRRRFREELERAASQAKQAGRSLAVLVLDLDHFKDINDRLGPSQGDDVLRSVAETLRQKAPSESCLARIGGDSFGMCVAGVEAQAAAELAEGLVASLRSRTVETANLQMSVTGSCGVALFPLHTENPEELLVLAETAMYAAKSQGRDRVVTANPDPAWRARYHVSMEELSWLREAIRRGELVAVAQPIVDLRSGGVSRYELLVRLPGPDRGILEPARFLDLAEQHNLVTDIDLWMCRRAAQLLQSRAGLSLHVNLSGATLTDPVAFARLLALVEEMGSRASRLVLEITERMALAELPRVMPAVEALRSRGVGLALDDFGTGVSSLYLLRHLSPDCVKVDRVFVRNVTSHAEDRGIVRSVVELCHSWGREVVAEGVEDAETLQLLRQMGVDYAQGYFFGRPAPDEELLGG